jgi:hypothetical protein
MGVNEQISELVTLYLIKKSVVESLTEALKDATKELTEVECDLLPSAMESADVSEFTTVDGVKVTIKEDIQMSIREANRALAFDWLRRNNHADLLKNMVMVEFGKGQDAHANMLAEVLKGQGYSVEQKEDVNTASVKSVLKKEMAEGADIPLDVFGGYHYKKAIVKIKN